MSLLYCKASRPALVSTQPGIQWEWVRKGSAAGGKRRGHTVRTLRMRVVTPPLLPVPSLAVQGQFWTTVRVRSVLYRGGNA